MKEKWNKLKSKAAETWEKLKAAVAKGLGKLGRWIVDNPDKAAAGVSLAIGGGKLALRAKRKHDEQVRTEQRFYDRRSDTYSCSKRPLKPYEKRELEIRYRQGELKSEVLREMGLLKY